ncbi:hypothetical protein [Luteibacter yeojuensis]
MQSPVAWERLPIVTLAKRCHVGAVNLYGLAGYGVVFAFPRDRQITDGGPGMLLNVRRWLSFDGDVAHAFTKVIWGMIAGA